jgi:hypothetical protein
MPRAESWDGAGVLGSWDKVLVQKPPVLMRILIANILIHKLFSNNQDKKIKHFKYM